MLASHKVKNGFCTVAFIWPAAATMRLIAEMTVGCDVNVSDGEVGSCTESKEGKSKGTGVPKRGVECEEVA